MSFLSRRRRAQTPLQDSGNYANAIATSVGPASIHSVDKPPSVIRRHINLSSPLSKLTSKLSSKSRSSNLAHAPIGNVGIPFGHWRSRSPSPAPSLDIRMPTGLGRRASELGEREDFVDVSVEEPHHGRKRSISLPAAAQAARWREAMAREEAQASTSSSTSAEKIPAISRLSPELLTTIFTFAARRDIVSLARVSKSFSQAALSALYDALDLRDVDDEHAAQCIASLASRRPLALLVRHFTCRTLPEDASSLDTVTFAIAFNNMERLRALTLPRFDLRLLCHTTFTLERLTLLCKNISAQEFHALFRWLARQPSLTVLTLPNLVLHDLPPPVDAGTPTPPHTPRTPDTPPHDSNVPVSSSSSPSSCHSTIPDTVLPNLRRVHAPAVIASALAASGQRPLESTKILIQNTLYDGLRPSAIMGALAAARGTLRTLTIKPASARIDGRTLERVVMAAGAELGGFVETLEVHWVLDDESLYKLMASALSRFRALRTLRLLRDSPPPFPPSPLLEFPLPPASPPLSAGPGPGTRTSISSFSSAFPPAAERTLGGRGRHAVPAGARARALGTVEQDVPELEACVLLVWGGVERAAAEPERGGAWVWWDAV
ncbi:hypothetical protein ONZ51_g7402 [Trametes cubensis]|uniref:F-box domain-containing protein n=1 Tax=Trametes cubensis TaxID=1111947 RepID=A0AAD7XBU0_9APHY|nr:hypothetical protein ONZ51_g7402 [Trametes cubensis]